MIEETNKTTKNLTNPLLSTKLGSTVSVVDAVALLWRKKYILLLFVCISVFLGVSYAMWVRPQFTSDALLQVNTKGHSSKSTKALGEMGAVLDLASPADAEIELLRSRMVLGYVVEKEHLRYIVTPVGFWDRITHNEGRMDLDSLELPRVKNAGAWMVEVLGENVFSVIAPNGKTVLNGSVGELYTVEYNNDTMAIRVSLLDAEVGQKFILGKISLLNAERKLSASLSVVEKGKQTGIIAIRYNHRSECGNAQC